MLRRIPTLFQEYMAHSYQMQEFLFDPFGVVPCWAVVGVGLQ